MQITLGQQYNVGEKTTVILYIYINRHAGTPEKYDKIYLQLTDMEGLKLERVIASLSGHAIEYQWRSLPRVHRHRASNPQGRSSNGCCLGRSPWTN